MQARRSQPFGQDRFRLILEISSSSFLVASGIGWSEYFLRDLTSLAGHAAGRGGNPISSLSSFDSILQKGPTPFFCFSSSRKKRKPKNITRRPRNFLHSVL
jgi:hypothetical protein